MTVLYVHVHAASHFDLFIILIQSQTKLSISLLLTLNRQLLVQLFIIAAVSINQSFVNSE